MISFQLFIPYWNGVWKPSLIVEWLPRYYSALKDKAMFFLISAFVIWNQTFPNITLVLLFHVTYYILLDIRINFLKYDSGYATFVFMALLLIKTLLTMAKLMFKIKLCLVLSVICNHDWHNWRRFLYIRTNIDCQSHLKIILVCSSRYLLSYISDHVVQKCCVDDYFNKVVSLSYVILDSSRQQTLSYCH